MGTAFHKRHNGSLRRKIIRRLRRSLEQTVTEKRRKLNRAQKALLRRVLANWNEQGTSDSLNIPVNKREAGLFTVDFKSRADAAIRTKTRKHLETGINLTDLQIFIRPSIRTT